MAASSHNGGRVEKETSQRMVFAYSIVAFSVAAINNIWVTYNYPFFLGRLGSGHWFLAVMVRALQALTYYQS